jgi:hypothetical protein
VGEALEVAADLVEAAGDSNGLATPATENRTPALPGSRVKVCGPSTRDAAAEPSRRRFAGVLASAWRGAWEGPRPSTYAPASSFRGTDRGTDQTCAGDLRGTPDPHSSAVSAWLRRSKWAVLGSNQ